MVLVLVYLRPLKVVVVLVKAPVLVKVPVKVVERVAAERVVAERLLPAVVLALVEAVLAPEQAVRLARGQVPELALLQRARQQWVALPLA